MKSSLSRSQFLSGDLRGEKPPVRPPWSLPEALFQERCTGCGECVSACPQQIIRLGRGQLAQVDFRAGECDFCGDCNRSCTQGAIAPDEGQAPWRWTARIGDRCLARQRIECRSCGDVCESRAIRFALAVGSVAQPELSQEDCNGCGACITACPTDAIGVQQPGSEPAEGRTKDKVN